MFAPRKRIPDRLLAIERIERWTRERFSLPARATVSVLEVACRVPGCPPTETLVMFWIAEQRYQFKIFKALHQVVSEDVPYAWLKDALAVDDSAGWECC